MDEITANSAEAQASVTAAFDSVNLIDAIVGGRVILKLPQIRQTAQIVTIDTWKSC